MRGYGDAQARQIFRDLLDLPAQVEISNKEVRVEFHRRAHLPILLASDLCKRTVKIPWWSGYSLRLTTYTGRRAFPRKMLVQFRSVEIEARGNAFRKFTRQYLPCTFNVNDYLRWGCERILNPKINRNTNAPHAELA